MGLLGIETPYCGSFLLWKLWIHTSLKLTHAATCSCNDTFLWYLRTKDVLKSLKLIPELRLKADSC